MRYKIPSAVKSWLNENHFDINSSRNNSKTVTSLLYRISCQISTSIFIVICHKSINFKLSFPANMSIFMTKFKNIVFDFNFELLKNFHPAKLYKINCTSSRNNYKNTTILN